MHIDLRTEHVQTSDTEGSDDGRSKLFGFIKGSNECQKRNLP